MTEKKKIVVDWNDMTLREAAEFEKIAGMTFSAIRQLSEEERDRLPMEIGIAIVYVFTKREDPTYTLEQALDVKLRDFDIEVVASEAEDPTNAAEESAA